MVCWVAQAVFKALVRIRHRQRQSVAAPKSHADHGNLLLDEELKIVRRIDRGFAIQVIRVELVEECLKLIETRPAKVLAIIEGQDQSAVVLGGNAPSEKAGEQACKVSRLTLSFIGTPAYERPLPANYIR